MPVVIDQLDVIAGAQDPGAGKGGQQKPSGPAPEPGKPDLATLLAEQCRRALRVRAG